MSANATVVFIPHGGGPLPLMNEPGHASLSQFLKGYAGTISRPAAIVVISAHWEEDIVSITAAPRPPMLFDYHGFPDETYTYEYPASGHPELAGRMQEMLDQAGIKARLDQQRGFDHGVFVPLMLMYPDADIPCLQISLSTSLDAAEHLRIGSALAPLRDENLLLLGSGFSFHNMQALMSKRDDLIDERNQAFEAWLAETCCDPALDETQREDRLQHWDAAPHARYCHPREEHLLPLQVCYGLTQSAARLIFQEKVAGFITSAYQWD